MPTKFKVICVKFRKGDGEKWRRYIASLTIAMDGLYFSSATFWKASSGVLIVKVCLDTFLAAAEIDAAKAQGAFSAKFE